jgi:hypothetical protein
MRSIIAISIAALLTAGCATNTDYKMYAETQQKIAQANAVAQTAKYNALAEIAKSGDSAAKVAAVLSIHMGNNAGGAQSAAQQNIAAPEDLNQKMLRWAGVLLPTVTQGLGIAAQLHAANVQKQIAVTQSNNAAATAQSTNNTFAAMSTNMATSNTNIAKAGFDAVVSGTNAIVTVSNAGITGVSNTAAAGLTATQNTATSGLTATTTAATAGLTTAGTLGTAGIAGVNTAAATGVTGLNTAVVNANLVTSNVAAGYTSALETAIGKLTGTTTTTTTTSTTTTTNNVACPAGQTFTAGRCQ